MEKIKLNFLSKIVLFVLPILVACAPIVIFIFQLNMISETRSNIKDNERQTAYYKEVLANPDLIEENNKQSTNNLLANTFGCNLANFSDYWNYDIYVSYGNVIKDVNEEFKKSQLSAPTVTYTERIDYGANQVDGKVKVNIIFVESCNFDCGGYDDLIPFPEIIIDSCSSSELADDLRIRQFTESNLNEQNFFRANEVQNVELTIVDSPSANVKVLNVSFDLVSATSSLSLDQVRLFWFDTANDMPCAEIAIKAC